MVPSIDLPLRMAAHLGLSSPDTPLFAHSALSCNPADQLRFLANTGFSGVFDMYLKLRPLADQTIIATQLADLGLELGTFNNDLAHWDQPLWSQSDAASLALIRASVESSASLVAQMGSGAAVCVTGREPAREKSAQIAAMIANLRLIAPLAQDRGLTLLIEPVAPQWIPDLLVETMADGAEIIDAVDSSAVRLLFDSGHCAMVGDDVSTALDQHWHRIGGIQIADVPGRVEPGAGVLDWTAIFNTLSARNFTGLVEMEFLPTKDSAEGEAHILHQLHRIHKEYQESQR